MDDFMIKVLTPPPEIGDLSKTTSQFFFNIIANITVNPEPMTELFS